MLHKLNLRECKKQERLYNDSIETIYMELMVMKEMDEPIDLRSF